MSRQVSNRACHSQSDDRLPRARDGRRTGLGPVGNSMIELIGASLLAKSGALQGQPQSAIWSKL